MTERIYLTRRNLETLLSKLNRRSDGDSTECTIVKYQNGCDEPYKQTMDACIVTAVEDSEYYRERPSGPVHPFDRSNLTSEKPPH